VGVEPRAVACQPIQTLGRGRAEGCLSEPGEEGVKVNSTTPGNKLARHDHHKGKEEGGEMPSPSQRRCGVSEERGVDGSDDDFSWC